MSEIEKLLAEIEKRRRLMLGFEIAILLLLCFLTGLEVSRLRF